FRDLELRLPDLGPVLVVVDDPHVAAHHGARRVEAERVFRLPSRELPPALAVKREAQAETRVRVPAVGLQGLAKLLFRGDSRAAVQLDEAEDRVRLRGGGVDLERACGRLPSPAVVTL